MKTFVAAALVLLCPVVASAQSAEVPNSDKNVLRIAPLGFINKVRVHYERVLGKQVSIGLIGTSYYGLYAGLKAEPFIMLYFSEKGAPRGFYLQGKMSYGSYSANLCHDFDGDGDADGWDWDDRHAAPASTSSADLGADCEGDVSFTTIGADIGIGAQGFIGKKKRTSIDFSVSLQYNPLPDSFREKIDATAYSKDWKNAWYIAHGGAVVAPMLSVGRSF